MAALAPETVPVLEPACTRSRPAQGAHLSTMDHREHTRQERRMHQHRTAWQLVVLAFVLTLTLAPRGMAQHPPSQRPHPEGLLMAAHTHDEDDDEDKEGEHGQRGHEGRMGPHHLDRLAQQLKLSDEQRAQIRTM